MNTHKIVELTSPVSVILRCSCGWAKQFDRRQNALARAQKVRAAKAEHERQAANSPIAKPRGP